MKYKGQLRGKFFKAIGFNGCLLIVFLLIVGISVYVQYVKEETVIATVKSITAQGGNSGDDNGGENTPVGELEG